MRNLLRRHGATLLAAYLLAGCSGTSDTAAPPTSPPPITPAPVAPGIVNIASSGLPAGAAADVQLVGPLPGASFSRSASAGTSWSDVPAGRYLATVRPVRTPLGRWVGAPDSFELAVPPAVPVSLAAVYRPAPSLLMLTVTGLPGTAAAAVTVTAPGGTPTAAPQGSTFAATQRTDVPTEAERWQVAAAPVLAEGARFAPARVTFDSTVSFGDTARVAIGYTVATGSLAVAVTGLPASVAAAVRVLGPGSDSTLRALTATTTLVGLEPGRYRVVSAPVVQQGITFRPAADTLAVDVVASLTAAPAPVPYAAQVGRLTLQVTGVPAGAAAAIRLVGNGVDRSVAGHATVDSLPAGSYTVTATSILAGGDRWAPTPATQPLAITTGGTSTATVSYMLASGSLAVTFVGLPAGLAGDVRVTGPGSFARTLTASDTVRGLEPGRYTLTPRAVRGAAGAFGVPLGSVNIDVAAGAAPATATMNWVLVPTVVDVPVSGLPAGIAAAIQLIDPSGEAYSATSTRRILPAMPGRWRQTASIVTIGIAVFTPTPASRDTTVLAGDTLVLGVTYTRTTGALAVAVLGLPTGTNANVTVSGPNGFTRTLTATTTLGLLPPGVYTVTAAPVSAGAASYTPTPATQSVTVTATAVAAGATVSYALPGGSIAIAASGLPAGSTPVFTLSGPGGPRTQNGAGTVSGLAPGSWTVSAATVSNAGTTFTPSPASSTVTVATGGTATASFAYSAGGAGTNYTISAVYLTQAIQKLDNSVALVANRNALLRVFVTATAANSARPDVRVRLYDGPTLVSTTTLTAPESAVRTTIAEGTLASTWNLPVPGTSVRPGLRVLVDLDPAQAIPDANRNDNVWPATGEPRPITVNTVPTFSVRFIPVITGNDTGRVTTANRESFLVTTRRLFPLQEVVSEVRAPFTSSADTLQSNDANGRWLTVLSEMNALRTTDGAPASTYYYGVVRVRYTSGVAGYGYVPGRAAIGWDYLPSGDNVAAHEWGHNFSRNHAPCGTSGDPNYPYAGGVIGGFGWNPSTNTIVSNTATDIMSYCSTNWISDYNWTAVMNHRGTAGFAAPAQAAVKGDGLLVWGRVIDGRIELEPAFRVQAPITPAARNASHQVELLDDGGAVLGSLPLESSVVDHVEPGHEQRHFAVVLPWSATLEERLAAVRVRDTRVPLRAALQRAGVPRAAAAVSGGDPGATLDRTARRVRVRWDNASYRMAMVRDAATGELMGFVRRPGAEVATGGRATEVVFSDGVRSVVRR
ncbi:hypothetical protein [Gemmatimonas sp.]|uniref:hypothetical protein n=1 Tax=Gemmatimonas sp. TaxID=1962908 RepID=UPI00391BA079